MLDLTFDTTLVSKDRLDLKMAAILTILKYLDTFILTSDMNRSLQIMPEKN